MRRRSIVIGIAIFGGFLLLCIIAFLIAMKYTPRFYRDGARSTGPDRQLRSREFVNTWTNMMSSIISRYEDGWGGVFTTEQVNCFLQEDFIRAYGGDENLPEGFHDLRIQIDENRLRLGCRYGNGFWSTILSIDLRIWLVAGDTNLLAVEILNLKAGAIPISPQFILDYITEIARRSNIDVRWYHLNGNPVATFKLQADQRHPTIQLQRFELQQGQIVIVGRPVEPPIGIEVGELPRPKEREFNR